MDTNVLYDDGAASSLDDSGVLFESACGKENLRVLQTGDVTAIAFGDRGVRDAACITTFYKQIIDLIEQNQSRALILDMRGVWFLPSRTLGAFLSLRKCVDRIELHNVSDDVRESLRIAQLEDLLNVSPSDDA